MSFRFTNRTALSSLALAGVSFGLLACGGGGEAGDNQPLGNNVMLSLETTLSATVDNQERSFMVVLQVTGNGSDLPEVTINAASTSDAKLENETIFLYRRDGNTATVDGTFTVKTGQWVAPGPVQMTNKDKVYVTGVITFNESAEDKDTTGTFNGNFRYDSALIENGEITDDFISFTSATATVVYDVL